MSNFFVNLTVDLLRDGLTQIANIRGVYFKHSLQYNMKITTSFQCGPFSKIQGSAVCLSYAKKQYCPRCRTPTFKHPNMLFLLSKILQLAYLEVLIGLHCSDIL